METRKGLIRDLNSRTVFRELVLCAAKDGMGDIVQTAPEHILEIIGAAIWSLCMKMNMSQEEAAEFAGNLEIQKKRR